MSIIKFFVKMLDFHFFKFGMEYPSPQVKIKFILCATINVDQLYFAQVLPLFFNHFDWIQIKQPVQYVSQNFTFFKLKGQF